MSLKEKEIKCVIWDLDHTIWNGVLLESPDVKLRPGIAEALKELDARGILQSISSKNEHVHAYAKLEELGIANYFLYPAINWNAKSGNVSWIQSKLNIGMDTMLFLDDQPFERDEVTSVHPEVTCWSPDDISGMLSHARLNPAFITVDSARRRDMYRQDQIRNEEEEQFEGPKEEFLASLQMEFIISEAQQEDLKRAEELTVRTNQLNSTGITYDFEELDRYRSSDRHKLLVCELTDRYGSYGKIGMALIEKGDTAWHMKLLLMSCRVMSRGVGSVLLSHIMQECKADNKVLRGDFRKTGRNRMMEMTYRFSNFKEIHNQEDVIVFENDLTVIQPFPSYIQVKIEDHSIS
ncbi:HAD-IIIC family phosphatase [Paenibacillus sp. SC116]|uniref:HAD-IIIC family phosphatase n=1 Tax=Paenibacillus sp. SC116 TaxID=2968986 RepID=UPI00215AE768|nr:HAD-IIIC family phosphatase [Paenibacillus sp. SC116]MCR8843805.1 HAD-IIIC family phosphatase [Paenibacillus sp. SC116]